MIFGYVIEKCLAGVQFVFSSKSVQLFKSYEPPNPKNPDFCQIFESEYLSREWEFCKSAKRNVVQLIEIYLPTKFQVEIRKFLDKQTNKLLPISKVDIILQKVATVKRCLSLVWVPAHLEKSIK